MTVKQITPYLFFNGTASEALALYERALGATVEGLMRYAEMPASAGTTRPEDEGRVMHALVRVGEASFMVSDTPADHPMPPSGNVQVVLDFDDVDDMTHRFDAMAKSGEVTMPLQDAFWGARYGMLTDKHGVRWQFNCALPGR